ncbi:MAG: glucan biosynthesis protein G [Pseudomonadota bacterium]|jgi:Periplasmic glucans biosynthesis protein|nr:MAG: glucan biosynthesis protein D [Pseudomonadota bacterium]
MAVRQRLLIVALIAATLMLANTTGGSPDVRPPQPQQQPQKQFDFSDVQNIARERAQKPYERRTHALPEALQKIDYDAYRDIRFRPERALWRGEGLFEVQFFHRGFAFRDRVSIAEVSPSGVSQVAYSPAMFDFGRNPVPEGLSDDTGFAGFRVHFPLHTPLYKDELIVFLGASYFRVLGRNQVYGLSARGLAIDTGLPRGEEFPVFTDFWLVKPGPTDRKLTIYALLDSESVTGAYRFDILPGGTTRVEVTSELYARKPIEKVGIAPLTSMFLYGENGSDRRFDDFRPEVHDSDGVMAQTGTGEWLWRPLVNPAELRISRLMDENPRGFGLIQRDRDFQHYQDAEARYHVRPSYWIEPHGQWGRGGVEIVEIPSQEEIHDNIVAYWVPETPIEPGKPVRYSYAISAFSTSHQWPPGGRVISTRIGKAAMGDYVEQGWKRFVIDFAGGDLDGLDRTQPVEAHVSGEGVQIEAVSVERVPDTGAWRVAFRAKPNGRKAIDLRCYLTLYGESLTETWTYLWNP